MPEVRHRQKWGKIKTLQGVFNLSDIASPKRLDVVRVLVEDVLGIGDGIRRCAVIFRVDLGMRRDSHGWS